MVRDRGKKKSERDHDQYLIRNVTIHTAPTSHQAGTSLNDGDRGQPGDRERDLQQWEAPRQACEGGQG